MRSLFLTSLDAHMRPIRDSYNAHVWLEGSAVAFLDSLYPDDELAVQIARFVNDGMKKKRRRQSSASPHGSSSVQVLHAVPDVVQDKATAHRILDLEAQNNELKQAIAQLSQQLSQALPSLSQSPDLATPPARPTRAVSDAKVEVLEIPEHTEQALKPRPSKGRISANAIGQLQEIAQKAKAKMPVYELIGANTDFECECRFCLLGERHFVKGQGTSKKAAKVEAAVKMLLSLGYTHS